MDPLIAYIIPHSGLKQGIHTFDFQTDAEFFAAMPDSPIQEGNVKARMTMDKKTDMLVFDFDFEGDLTLPCDRCTEDYFQKVKGTTQYIVKFADKEYEEDEILYVKAADGQISVAHFLYESILLELPTRRVHPLEKCNPDVVALIMGESDLAPNSMTDDAFGNNEQTPNLSNSEDINPENPFVKALKDIKIN
jgi:uncharacterized protein